MALPDCHASMLRVIGICSCAFATIAAANPTASAAETNLKSRAAAAEAAVRQGDYVRARAILEQLARQGHGPSQYRLAGLLRTGRGGAADAQSAFHWMKKALAASYSRARVPLAMMYIDGYGTPVDRPAGRRLLERAAADGDGDATQLLAKLNSGRARVSTRQTGWETHVAPSGQRSRTAGDADPGQAATPADIRNAAARGLAVVVRRMVKQSADLNMRDKQGRTALMMASRAGHYETAKALIDGKADVNARSSSGETALEQAAMMGHRDIVALLVKSGARPSSGRSTNRSAAAAAIAGCHVASLSFLAHHARFQPSLRRHANRLLILASSRCGGDVVKVVLGLGANVKATDDQNRSALWHAASAGRSDAVKLLLANGADAGRQDARGVAPLLVAIRRRHQRAALALIDKVPTPDAASANGNTPLMLAANAGLVGVAKALIQRQVGLNQKNRQGMTALMLAAYRGHTEIVRLLLGHGANPHLRNSRREQAIDLAKAAGHAKLASLLSAR
jgi:uncharacterized protein